MTKCPTFVCRKDAEFKVEMCVLYYKSYSHFQQDPAFKNLTSFDVNLLELLARDSFSTENDLNVILCGNS